MGISLNPSTILSGQGINVSSLVQQIITSQSGELSVWQNQGTTLATQDGVLEGIENDLVNLQTAVTALNDPAGALTAQAATSSNPAVLTATAQSGAVPGSHEVTVNSLATTGTLFTDPIQGTSSTSGADVPFLTGAANADIELSIGGTTQDIVVSPPSGGSSGSGGNDTLNTLASYINAQSAASNWGVTATVIGDSSGERLSLQSQNTGSTGALAILATASIGTLTTADLASADSSVLASGSTTGQIQLQIGGASGTTQTINISSADGNTTLNGLAQYINNQNWGVTASVVADSNGAHLQIQNSATGAAGALAFTGNSSALTLNSPTSLTFDAPQGGTNATLNVDGQNFTSPSNTVTGLIQGVTLNLASQSPGNPVQVSVGPDVNQITSAINNFVSAYNTLVTTINGQYAVDPTGATPAPPLESDTSLRSLQSSILADAAYALPGATGATTVNGGLINLASLGINMNNDGTLTVGSNASGQSFAQIVSANPSAVLNFFQNASNAGFANVFNTDLTNLTDSTTGPLNVDVAQNEAEQQTLTSNITNFQTQLSNQQTQLTQQYDSVNASLQAYPLLLQQVTETLGTLGSGTSSSGALISSEPTLTSGL